jgi:hypothetical protein
MKSLRLKISFCILLVTLLFNSCVKENLAECVYRLTFDFRQPGEDLDMPLEKISSLSVFSFDEKGKFVEEFKVVNPKQGQTVQIPVPDGEYTLVTWAGFTEQQRTEANLTKGTSLITDLYMRTFTTGPQGNSSAPNPLYYGIVRDVPIALPPETLIQDVSLKHSSKPLNIRISGMDVANYQMIITNNAAKYDYNNVLVPAGLADNSTREMMRAVSPIGTYVTQTSLLWPSALGEQKITFLNLTTGYPVLTLSLTDLFKKLPNVDFNKEHSIDLIINYLSDVRIEVNINGWLIVYSDDEV